MLHIDGNQAETKSEALQDREQFKRYNRNSSWAEAFYQELIAMLTIPPAGLTHITGWYMKEHIN